jgi:hypothetical protein
MTPSPRLACDLAFPEFSAKDRRDQGNKRARREMRVKGSGASPD